MMGLCQYICDDTKSLYLVIKAVIKIRSCDEPLSR